MNSENIKSGIIGLTGSLISLTGINMGEIESIVSIVCGIVGLFITIMGVIVIPVWKKIRDAKKDGKIEPEEVEDIVKVLKDGMDKIDKGDKK